METKNLKYNKHGTIDMEFNHPKLGWIPFTASEEIGEYGHLLYAAAIAGEFGKIDPYIAPPLPTADEVLASKRELASMTRKEFFQALRIAGLYDAVKAIGDDPATPLEIRIDLAEASSFDRNYPSLIEQAYKMGLTDTNIDSLFGIT